MIRGVVFDLDGAAMESEEDWERARRDVVGAFGGAWMAGDQRIEDSGPGIRSARAAGLRVIAAPSAAHPTRLEMRALADLAPPSLVGPRPEAIARW